ncbi:uncharacterized protein LOC128211476 [Mya arenaria]|uniref:uncharacterized protein LOC128211476 n=1 Tax=Mya arenaria TaxID=6604 RepID=UPI0022E46AA8|nr:uncharacterized protein LOC128211476 [Mya arenaria]
MDGERARVAAYIARYARRMLVSAILLVPGALLIVAATASPGWTVLETGHSSLHLGIWYLVTCEATVGCDMSVYQKLFRASDIRSLRIMACTASMTAIISPILFVIARRRIIHHKGIMEIGFCALCSTLCAGVLGFVLTGITAHDLASIDDAEVLSELRGPYSIIMMAIGSAVEVGVCVLLAWTMVEKYIEDRTHEQGDTWLALSRG